MLTYTRIACKYETQFNGFRVPLGACYGRDRDARFVCVDYTGINKGYLTVFSQEGGRRWKQVNIDRKDWRYKAVRSALSDLGYIPKVKTFKDPYKRIPGRPVERKVNYNFMPTGSGAGQLVRMSHDNADHSGGGSNIHNAESYWTINVDMERRCTVNPLYE